MLKTIPKNISYTCADGIVVPIRVRLSRRARRLSLKLREGSFTLVVPEELPTQVLDEALPTFYTWIEEKHVEALVHKIPEDIPTEIEIPIEAKTYAVILEDGTSSIYGKAATAKGVVSAHMKDSSERVYCFEFEDKLDVVGSIANKHLVAYTLQLWARGKADFVLAKHVRKLAHDRNISIGKVTIRDQRSRWGSCSGRQGQLCNISLNWRAILLPVDQLTHLCHHELCHVLHMNHSRDFHRELQNINANAEELESELSYAWKKLPWWSRHIENLS